MAHKPKYGYIFNYRRSKQYHEKEYNEKSSLVKITKYGNEVRSEYKIKLTLSQQISSNEENEHRNRKVRLTTTLSLLS